jgi:hypothetical protein
VLSVEICGFDSNDNFCDGCGKLIISTDLVLFGIKNGDYGGLESSLCESCITGAYNKIQALKNGGEL